MARIGEGAPAPAGLVSPLDTQPVAQTKDVAQVQTQAGVPAQAAATATAEVRHLPQDQFQIQPFPLPGQGIVEGGCYPQPPYHPLPFPFPPQPLPFPLPEPQPLPLPHPFPFPPCPPPPAPRDASADAALKQLDQQPKPISGEAMAKAIKQGTEDLDGQAANQEYKQFADWAAKNQANLSPEAKEVMKVYEKYAKQAQFNGQTGINTGDYDKMVKEMNTAGATDVSAKKAIDQLSKGDGKVSGEDMTRAIEQGTKDLDNSSAGREFKQFADWAAKNPDRLTPEAKQVLDIYKKYADAAKGQGASGIAPDQYQKMLGEMKEVKTYKDESAGKALDRLNHLQSPVSGQQMLGAIRNGTQDLDGQAAGKEMQDLIAWARDNASRLSPEAKQVVAIYMKYATQALVNGQTGINQGDYQQMLNEMRQALRPPVFRPLPGLDAPVAG